MPEPTRGSPYELHMRATPAFTPARVTGQLPHQIQTATAQPLIQRRPRKHLLHVEAGTAVAHLDHQTPTAAMRFNLEIDAYKAFGQRAQAPGALLVIVGKALHIALEL